MKKQLRFCRCTVGFGLALVATAAFADPIEITRADYAPAVNSFNGGPFSPTTAGTNEDNEVEKVGSLIAIANQSWDMEAFTLDGTKLSIVSGYNLSTGQDNWRPGDLFIKIGGADPGAGLNTSSPVTVANNLFPSGQGYTYAVDLSLASIAAGASTTNVYSLSTSSLLDTVNWDGFLANPWKYNTGALSTSTTAIHYASALKASEVATLTGVAGLSALKDDVNNGSPDTTRSHNVLTVDLGFLTGLVPPGTTVWFSYTMECGNDSLKGRYGGGFEQVPDGGATAVLVGLGLCGLSLLGWKRRQA